MADSTFFLSSLQLSLAERWKGQAEREADLTRKRVLLALSHNAAQRALLLDLLGTMPEAPSAQYRALWHAHLGLYGVEKLGTGQVFSIPAHEVWAKTNTMNPEGESNIAEAERIGRQFFERGP